MVIHLKIQVFAFIKIHSSILEDSCEAATQAHIIMKQVCRLLYSVMIEWETQLLEQGPSKLIIVICHIVTT